MQPTACGDSCGSCRVHGLWWLSGGSTACSDSMAYVDPWLAAIAATPWPKPVAAPWLVAAPWSAAPPWSAVAAAWPTPSPQLAAASWLHGLWRLLGRPHCLRRLWRLHGLRRRLATDDSMACGRSVACGDSMARGDCIARGEPNACGDSVACDCIACCESLAYGKTGFCRFFMAFGGFERAVVFSTPSVRRLWQGSQRTCTGRCRLYPAGGERSESKNNMVRARLRPVQGSLT